jgi:ketosteroid isomerase-like protein
MMNNRSLHRVRQAGLTGAALAVSLLLAGCAQPPADAPANITTAQEATNVTNATREALTRHQQAFGSSDIEAMLGGYSADAVMFTPNGLVRGVDALRPVFEGLFAEWGKPTTKFTMKQEIVDGEYAYMFWDAETDDNIYEGGMDAFVIRDGKKVAHFFSAKITPKTKP